MVVSWNASNDQWALVCNYNVQRQISNWLSGLVLPVQVNVGMTDSIYGKFHRQIISQFSGGIIPVIPDNNMPNNQVYLFNTDKVRVVYRERPTIKWVDSDQLTDFDGAALRLRTKVSLQYQNSFANVGVIYGVQ